MFQKKLNRFFSLSLFSLSLSVSLWFIKKDILTYKVWNISAFGWVWHNEYYKMQLIRPFLIRKYKIRELCFFLFWFGFSQNCSGHSSLRQEQLWRQVRQVHHHWILFFICVNWRALEFLKYEQFRIIPVLLNTWRTYKPVLYMQSVWALTKNKNNKTTHLVIFFLESHM
jgi:hypothetical protein